MLEFVKKILVKVSFDKELFQKELKKSFKFLSSKELLALYSWCIVTFGDRYRDTIVKIFTDSKILH